MERESVLHDTQLPALEGLQADDRLTSGERLANNTPAQLVRTEKRGDGEFHYNLNMHKAHAIERGQSHQKGGATLTNGSFV